MRRHRCSREAHAGPTGGPSRVRRRVQLFRDKTTVGFNLIDLAFAIVCFGIGVVFGQSLASHSPAYLRLLAGSIGGLCVYVGLVYPFYRGLKLYPMVIPRCPCCGRFQDGFHVLGGDWPRVRFRCPTCNREFVIWFNGKPGDQETWEHPVLALKWPYALGIYKRAIKPGPREAPNGDFADVPPAPAS
jgi:hypothetical protein